jgi:hypothetical protein
MPIETKSLARKSWRDLWSIHPAADLFPRMTPDELRALGEDIIKNGLTSPIALWRSDPKGEAAPMSYGEFQAAIRKWEDLEKALRSIIAEKDKEIEQLNKTCLPAGKPDPVSAFLVRSSAS